MDERKQEEPQEPKQNLMAELVEGILRGAENNPVMDSMRPMAKMMRASYGVEPKTRKWTDRHAEDEGWPTCGAEE